MADVKELNINNTTYDIKAKSVVDTNSGSVKMWTGTRQQYEAIITKDANTLYNITDDTDVTLSLLNLLYPVGSIYIGTMATCPLATLGIGTWQLVASDRVLQGAGTSGTVGSTVEQYVKLPNINGSVGGFCGLQIGSQDTMSYINGAFYRDTSAYAKMNNGSGDQANALGFDASRSSSVYSGDGTDTKIQPPAYLVNIWERVA